MTYVCSGLYQQQLVSFLALWLFERFFFRVLLSFLSVIKVKPHRKSEKNNFFG